jgi:hypothetical protein
MPATVDPGDTARLNLAGDTAEPESTSTSDTADFGPGYPGDPPETGGRKVQVRRFAEGIIRFYRARTILGRGGSDELSWLAWSYVVHLEPADIPAVARPAFFDLAYFMRVQALEGAFDNDGFRTRILDVAVIMDGFLDDIFNARA